MRDLHLLYREVQATMADLSQKAQSGHVSDIFSYSQRLHGLARQLFISLDLPADTPEDFEQLQWTYAHCVHSVWSLPHMPYPYFEEFLGMLTTAYSMGRREGYSERMLEVLLGEDMGISGDTNEDIGDTNEDNTNES